jgi:hypothetical protein
MLANAEKTKPTTTMVRNVDDQCRATVSIPMSLYDSSRTSIQEQARGRLSMTPTSPPTRIPTCLFEMNGEQNDIYVYENRREGSIHSSADDQGRDSRSILLELLQESLEILGHINQETQSGSSTTTSTRHKEEPFDACRKQ